LQDVGYEHRYALLVYNIPGVRPMQLQPAALLAPQRRSALPHLSQQRVGAPQTGDLSGRAIAAQKPRPGVKRFTGPPREEALGHWCETEEEPMSDLAARFVYAPLLSTGLKVVCLFCVFGLALSAVVIPLIAPEYLTWVLAHIE
jgi:hypothetical protein